VVEPAGSSDSGAAVTAELSAIDGYGKDVTASIPVILMR
jgi:hypothetical protein